MMKNKNIIKYIVITSAILLIFFSSFHPIFAQYKNQEKIPGAEQTSDFTQYLKDIINFGFAVIGILALFMLIIGAYQYLMAAGSGKAESAKETITSALLGLILGLCAWIILEKINPDLVNMRSITQISGGTPGTPPGTTPGVTPSPNAGKCTVTETGNCAVSALGCFGDQAKNASSVCMCESGGVVKIGGDKCDGTNVSSGLFQMNTTCHNLGMNCTSAYNGCLGTNVSNSSCRVLKPDLAQKCMAAMQNPTSNIQAACYLQKTEGWKHWTCAKTCGVI